MSESEWLDKFRNETDREKRLVIINEVPENEDVCSVAFRKKLVEKRYQTLKGKKIDTFIRGWINCSMLDATSSKTKISRSSKKVLDSILSDWQIEEAEKLGPEGSKVLEDEFYNMVLLYINISQNDQSYTTSLLGFKKLSKEAVTDKLARDIYRVSVQIPEFYNLTDTLAPLTRGAAEAFEYVFGRPLIEY